MSLFGFWFRLLDFFGIRNEGGPGYGAWSGIVGDVTIFAGVIIYLRHNNCGHKWCPFPGHATPKGHRICRLHGRKPLSKLHLRFVHEDHT